MSPGFFEAEPVDVKPDGNIQVGDLKGNMIVAHGDCYFLPLYSRAISPISNMPRTHVLLFLSAPRLKRGAAVAIVQETSPVDARCGLVDDSQSG
jgi:hypothetical protein